MDTRHRQLAVLVNSPRTRRRAAGVRTGRSCVIAAALLFAPQANADELDTLNFTLTETLTYESNIFRSPDNVGPRPGFNTKADRISVTTAGLKFDKPYAQQRLQFDVTQTVRRYSVFDYLDTEALNYKAAWLWKLTPYLSGTLSADQAQTEVPFVDVGGTQRNTRTTENRNLNIDAWLGGAWHLLAAFGQSESKTEQAIIAAPSFTSKRTEAGLRYDAKSGNSVTVTQRWIPAETINLRLDPVNLIETNYRDTESEVKASWKLSGRSILDGRLTHKVRTNEHFSQRDFSGNAGELRYVWTPTGKLQLDLTLGRNVLPYSAFGNITQNSTYSVENIQSLGGLLQVDAKVALNFGLSRRTADFLGPIFAVTAPARSDETRSARVGLNWKPIRNLSLNASVSRDQRDSNTAGFQYKGNVATLGLTLTF
jgi:exopolysaccharide biosynthesis operon protein EpsL